MRIIRFLFAALFGFGTLSAQAQGEEEAALFGDPASFVVDSNSITKPTQESEPQGIRFSGKLTGVGSESFYRDTTSPTLSSHMVGELYIDARTKDETKAFASIEARYLADSNSSQAHLRELFLDFNLKRWVYIRMGKQRLQWGRCYFWNPSDLINVERKAFIERAGSLEGVYGLRMHIPFGTRANLYGFWDTDGADHVNETKIAAKAELLLGSTETALSIWKRKGLEPVYAWDASSGIAKWNLAGEAAFFPEGFESRYQIRKDTLYEIQNAAFTPRIALSFGRSFDFLDVSDRISLQYEMYYNGLGYTRSPLDDERVYPWKERKLLDSAQMEILPMPLQSNSLRQGPKVLWLFANRSLQPYSMGRYYAAFFTSFSRFFIQDLTLSCNGLLNAVDRSYILSTALTYTTLSNLSLQAMVVRIGGDYPGELNYSGQIIQTQATVSYSF